MCLLELFTSISATPNCIALFLFTGLFVCFFSFKLSKMVQKDAEQESEMRAEIQEMKREQSSISMMDEFARYARLERKINKMTDKLKTHGEGHTQSFQPSGP